MAALGDTTGEKHKHVLTSALQWWTAHAAKGVTMACSKGPMAAAGVPRKQSCWSMSVDSRTPASQPQNRSTCPSTCQPRCLRRAPPPTSLPALALQHITKAPHWQRRLKTAVETENNVPCYIQEANGPTAIDTQTPQALTQWLFITFDKGRHIDTYVHSNLQVQATEGLVHPVSRTKAPKPPRLVQLKILTPTTAHTVPKTVEYAAICSHDA